MKSFKGSITVLLLVVALLALCCGCEYFRQASAGGQTQTQAQLAWNANLTGTDGNVTGGGFQVETRLAAPTPIPQLEKGNEREVTDAARAQERAPIITRVAPKATPTPAIAQVCPNGVCPYQNAVPFQDSQGGRSSSSGGSGSGAWYNGFL